MGANARWGRGRSWLARYPLSYHTSNVSVEDGELTRPPHLFHLQTSILYEYALFGADARRGRGRSRLAGYPSFYHMSIVFRELTRPSRLFYLQVSIFYEYALFGADARWGRGRSRLAGYPLSYHISTTSFLFTDLYFLRVCPLGG